MTNYLKVVISIFDIILRVKWKDNLNRRNQKTYVAWNLNQTQLFNKYSIDKFLKHPKSNKSVTVKCAGATSVGAATLAGLRLRLVRARLRTARPLPAITSRATFPRFSRRFPLCLLTRVWRAVVSDARTVQWTVLYFI